ncbi:MAG: 4Fe-4S binding protein [Phycisphaerae bacterium]
METRKVIKIDEEKCDGCGQCATRCAEGAIEIINGKAKLVSETYCDGLGACLGDCPMGALTIEDRPAEGFDPQAVHKHLAHRAEKPKEKELPCGCPGTMARSFDPAGNRNTDVELNSEIRNWPIQLKLVPTTAPYLNNAKLLISADCVPFAFADFHRRFLKDRVLLIGCPKLDDSELYLQKLTEIFRRNDIQSIEVLYMEVPCCFGLLRLVTLALDEAGKSIPLNTVKIGIHGDICQME